MEDLIYTMVLSDGTIIENLRKNGDNYILRLSLQRICLMENYQK